MGDVRDMAPRLLGEIRDQLVELNTRTGRLEEGQGRLEVQQRVTNDRLGRLEEGQGRLEVQHRATNDRLGRVVEILDEHVAGKIVDLDTRLRRVEAHVGIEG
jgi:hypothetical protein